MMRALPLIAAIAIAACGGSPAHPRPPPGPVLELAWPALDGGTIALADFRGQVVVLHAFATWSLAAQLEVEALGAADLRDDVVVIGVALDPEGYVLVSPWRKGSGVRYLIALTDEATRAGGSALGRIREVPTTFVLDRRGRVVERLDHQLSPAELDAAIARAAREP
jgi:peroxiredoxin